jgi:hypothetical protein
MAVITITIISTTTPNVLPLGAKIPTVSLAISTPTRTQQRPPEPM